MRVDGFREVQGLEQAGLHFFCFSIFLCVVVQVVHVIPRALKRVSMSPKHARASKQGALLGSVCGLLSTPYMPAWATFRGEPEEMCFFDAVCINQADAQALPL